MSGRRFPWTGCDGLRSVSHARAVEQRLQRADAPGHVAAELLELAKKELCKDCAANLEGYIKGRQDALKEMEENRVYKHEGPTIPAFWPPCHYGGECTNPFRDCLNCPRQTIGINTTTGTSAAKAEGKE